MTRILLADDHAVVRKGIKETLEEITGLVVKAEAGDADEILKKMAKERVDLLIMDISMPGRTGLEILAEIKRRWPRVPVLIYTMHSHVGFAVRAFKAGVAGYLTKEAPLAELAVAINKIMTGGRYVPTALGVKLAGHFATGGESPHQSLSERELLVMKLIAAGKSLKEIAQKLSLSANTISTYRTRILKKVHLRTDAALIRYVVEHELDS